MYYYKNMSQYHNNTSNFVFSPTATEFSPNKKNKKEFGTFNNKDLNVDNI